MDWYHIYHTLPAKWKLTAAALEALGTYLGSNDYDADKVKKVQGLIQRQTSIQSQFAALEPFRKRADMSTAPQTAKGWVHDIGRSALKETLDSAKALRKNAGENIVSIVIKYGAELVDPVVAALERCTTPTVAAFVLTAVASVSEGGNSAQLQLLEKMIKHLWSSTFDFEGPEFRTPKPNSWGRVQDYDSERDILTNDELVRLLEVTQRYGGMPAFDALPVLCLALPKVSSAYAKEQVLPFVEHLVKRKVPVLFPHDTRTPNGAVTELIRDGLTAIITNHVQPEPQRAANFTLPRGTCNCSDCQVINNFLVSQQTQYRFPCAKKRRQHLHQQFTDRGNSMYDVMTIESGSPHVWCITKTFDKRYANDHRAWTLRVKWLSGELNKLTKVQGGLLTEDLLGKDVYRGIMGCTVESLGSVGAGRALMEASGNVRKRKADYGADGDAKKARGMSWPGGVEIVDLT